MVHFTDNWHEENDETFKKLLSQMTLADIKSLPHEAFPYCEGKEQENILAVQQEYGIKDDAPLTFEFYKKLREENPEFIDYALHAIACYSPKLDDRSFGNSARMEFAKRIQHPKVLHRTYDNIPNLDEREDKDLSDLCQGIIPWLYKRKVW